MAGCVELCPRFLFRIECILLVKKKSIQGSFCSFFFLLIYLKDKRSPLGFLEDTTQIWKSCAQLKPKPRAFICVAGDKEMQKCKATIDLFQGMTGQVQQRNSRMSR